MVNSKECDEITQKMIEDFCRKASEEWLELKPTRLSASIEKAGKIISEDKEIVITGIKIIEEGPRVSLCSLKTSCDTILYGCRYNNDENLYSCMYLNRDEAMEDFEDLNSNNP